MMRNFVNLAAAALAFAGVLSCSSTDEPQTPSGNTSGDGGRGDSSTSSGGDGGGSSGGGDDGGGGGDAGCVPYKVPSGTSLTTPVVSFKNDVAPIFQMSCGNFSSCHQSSTGPSNNGVHLEGDPSAMRAGIVGKMSDKIDMNFVTASDLANSYLMHKIDGDQCTLNARCKTGDCLGSMPDRNPLMEIDRRDTVRRWIAQGALDN